MSLPSVLEHLVGVTSTDTSLLAFLNQRLHRVRVTLGVKAPDNAAIFNNYCRRYRPTRPVTVSIATNYAPRLVRVRELGDISPKIALKCTTELRGCWLRLRPPAVRRQI